MKGIYVITLGSGKVGIACCVSPEGKPGILFRPLDEPVEIGTNPAKPIGEDVDEGLFVQCTVLESALVLKRAVDALCEHLSASSEK